MPTTKVELDHGNEALYGVVELRDSQEHLRMAHEVRDTL